MTDKQLKSLLVKAGAVHAVLTFLFAAICWIFSAGKASADIVHRSDLAVVEQKLDKVQEAVNATREDVALIKGKLDR